VFELKPITPAAIPSALEKAERYRLLNEPWEAESICLDVLEIDPENQQALVTLLLALTDGFEGSPAVEVKRPTEVLGRLHDPYARHYYAGIIHERWGRAFLGKDVPAHIGMAWIREAMHEYEKAAAVSPAGNDDAILRWNACVRTYQRDEQPQSQPTDVKLTTERDHGDEMPVR
jgi:hypothetical protein